MYLEGAVKILSQRKTLDFTAMMCSKISLEDLKKPEIMAQVNRETIVLPPCMADMEEYMRALEIIAATNHII